MPAQKVAWPAGAPAPLAVDWAALIAEATRRAGVPEVSWIKPGEAAAMEVSLSGSRLGWGMGVF